MSVKELEKLAAAQKEMPMNMTASEQLLFLSLRCLYASYQTRKIDKETAKSEKTEILKTYEINVLKEKCYEQTKEIQREFAKHSHDIHNHGCEMCKRLSRVIIGITGLKGDENG